MTDLPSPRLAPLAALLLGLVVAGCDAVGTPGPASDPAPRIGDVVVTGGAADVLADARSARVLRAGTADPVVLSAATPGRFDAYFQVEVTSDAPIELDVIDQAAPEAPAARLRS